MSKKDKRGKRKHKSGAKPRARSSQSLAVQSRDSMASYASTGPVPPSAGTSYLFTFPFWIYVDTTSPPDIVEITLDGGLLRFYPPFRSAPANFMPMPRVDPRRIPFAPGTNLNISPDFEMPLAAAVPDLLQNSNEKPSFTAIWGTEWPDPPVLFPMDSLRIDALDLPGGQPSAHPSQSLTTFLQLLRYRTRQWWIGRSVDPLLGYLRNTFSVSVEGLPLEVPAGLGQIRTVSGDELAVNGAIWQAALGDLANAKQVPIFQVLLLDARFFVSTHDIRRAILDSAICCENVLDVTLERLWPVRRWPAPGTSRAYSYSRAMGGETNLGVNLATGMDRYIGRSFQREYPNDHEVIENLWSARGSVAHGGAPEYRRNGQLFQAGEHEAKEFVQTAERCVSWLESIE